MYPSQALPMLVSSPDAFVVEWKKGSKKDVPETCLLLLLQCAYGVTGIVVVGGVWFIVVVIVDL